MTIRHSSLRPLLLLLLRGETQVLSLFFLFFGAVTAGDSPRINALQCVFAAALSESGATAAPCAAAAASDPRRVPFRLADKRAKVTEGADTPESWQPGRLNHLAALWRSRLSQRKSSFPPRLGRLLVQRGRPQDRQRHTAGLVCVWSTNQMHFSVPHSQIQESKC